MSKMVKIEFCEECKNWDHAGDRCCLVHRNIIGSEHLEIPDWCPLPDAAHGEDSRSKSVTACNKLFAHALEQILRIIGHGHYEERLVIKQLEEYQVKETENG